MYVWDLLTCLILLCLIALARTLSFFARILNLHHPSKASRSFSLEYAAQVTGSSAAMMERGLTGFYPKFKNPSGLVLM